MRLLFLLSITIANFAVGQEAVKYITSPAITFKTTTFPLHDVKLLTGSPFKHAMDLNEQYLLQLDADRLLHRWRKNAGLKPKGELYGGWEANCSHMLGHYLSALSLQYAAGGKTGVRLVRKK